MNELLQEHEYELGHPRPWYRGAFLRDHGLLDRFEALPAWQAGLLVAAGVLGVDWAIAPKGQSLLAKGAGKLGFGHGAPLLPPPPRVPPPIPMAAVPPHVAAGYFAGANLQAGFGHGYMPYGPWAAANPGGPSQYAHAAQHHHSMFDWE